MINTVRRSNVGDTGRYLHNVASLKPKSIILNESSSDPDTSDYSVYIPEEPDLYHRQLLREIKTLTEDNSCLKALNSSQ